MDDVVIIVTDDDGHQKELQTELRHRQPLPVTSETYWIWQEHSVWRSFTLREILRFHLKDFGPSFLNLRLYSFSGLYKLVQACTSLHKPRKVICGNTDVGLRFD